MSSSTGKIFVVTTFGESHGAGMGAVVDGCPAGIKLSGSDIQKQMDRRKPGQSRLTTARKEQDRVEILSGIQDGVSLGSPIGLLVRNSDARPSDYLGVGSIPRPSHADLVYKLKYGIAATSGGGRASARETAMRVAAGVVAERLLDQRFGVEIVAWVSTVADVDAPDMSADSTIRRNRVDSTPVRCPDKSAAAMMIDRIESARDDGDSVGGIVTCVCRGVPAGWGEPVFQKLTACLASAMMSIPASKGFEVGSGFGAVRFRGSEHNDAFVAKRGRIGTVSNRSGGMQGGISNGEPLVFRVAFKPTASICREQETVDYKGRKVSLSCKGRHDPCVLPRAVPVVEAMAGIVLADTALIAGVQAAGGNR